MKRIGILAAVATLILSACFLFNVSGGSSGDSCASYRTGCDSCLDEHERQGRPLTSPCADCDKLRICEAGNPAADSKCKRLKESCDAAQAALERSGFPEKTSGACTDYYRECK